MSTAIKNAERLQRKALEQGGVEKPFLSRQCWALKRIYIGQKFASFVQCEKNHRPNHRTCPWHADRELAAQELEPQTD